MSSSNFEKIVKIMLWVLMIVSTGITVWGYAVGFNDASVNTLFYWAYVLMIVGIAAAVLFGIAISAINNPKNLIKMGIELVAVVVVVGAVYFLSSGAPAQGYIGPEVSHMTLKLTDTVLNLTYILCAVTILAIIGGGIYNAIRNK